MVKIQTYYLTNSGSHCGLTEYYVKRTSFSLRHTFGGRNLTQFNVKRQPASPNLQYFYHPDHLGSSSFITNAIVYAEQHPIAIGVQYLPFGELFVNQQNSTYDTRYKFSAKLKRSGNPATAGEKDNETQYSYFGARYYDSDLSVWLSVDPLSEKYPSLSPYMYVAGNPLNSIDPNGKDIWVLFEAVGGQCEVDPGHTAIVITKYTPVPQEGGGVLYRPSGYYVVENHPNNKDGEVKLIEYDESQNYRLDDVDASIQVKSGTNIGNQLYTYEEVQEELKVKAYAENDKSLFVMNSLKSNNCTDFAVRVLQKIGVDPNNPYLGVVMVETPDGKTVPYRNPNSLYNDLQGLGYRVAIEGDDLLMSDDRAREVIELQIRNHYEHEQLDNSSKNEKNVPLY